MMDCKGKEKILGVYDDGFFFYDCVDKSILIFPKLSQLLNYLAIKGCTKGRLCDKKGEYVVKTDKEEKVFSLREAKKKLILFLKHNGFINEP